MCDGVDAVQTEHIIIIIIIHDGTCVMRCLWYHIYADGCYVCAFCALNTIRRAHALISISKNNLSFLH